VVIVAAADGELFLLAVGGPDGVQQGQGIGHIAGAAVLAAAGSQREHQQYGQRQRYDFFHRFLQKSIFCLPESRHPYIVPDFQGKASKICTSRRKLLKILENSGFYKSVLGLCPTARYNISVEKGQFRKEHDPWRN
jgi:hypothetical protein